MILLFGSLLYIAIGVGFSFLDCKLIGITLIGYRYTQTYIVVFWPLYVAMLLIMITVESIMYPAKLVNWYIRKFTGLEEPRPKFKL